MPTYLFILLHLFYLLFLIFLINTYVKDVGEKKTSEILKINSDGIFIPENTTYNELYIQKLNLKKNFNIKYINILPYADTIVSKNGLWNLLKKYYTKQELYKYFPKTFILENIYDRMDFEKIFYNIFKNNNTNNIFILKKNINRKKGLKLFFIKNKSDIINIYNKYYLENYKLIQEFIPNPYTYDNKIVILRVYLIIKKIPKQKYIFKREKWIKCLYCKKEYNSKLKDKEIYISDSSYYNDKYPKNLSELLLIEREEEVLKKIDNIFIMIKKSTTELIFNNKILENSVQFQLFGCDFILNQNLDPFLLEINKDPCLNNNFNQEEEEIKKDMIKNMYNFVRNNKN